MACRAVARWRDALARSGVGAQPPAARSTWGTSAVTELRLNHVWTLSAPEKAGIFMGPGWRW